MVGASSAAGGYTRRELSCLDCLRHVSGLLPIPASVLELDRREAALTGPLDHRSAPAADRPRLLHDLVLDPRLVERLLDRPARMLAEVGPDVRATVQLQ